MAAEPLVEEVPAGCVIHVHAAPGASSASMAWDPWTGCLKVRVVERAVKGRANAAMMEELSARFGVRASLVSGAASRRKLVLLPGLTRGQVLAAVGPG